MDEFLQSSDTQDRLTNLNFHEVKLRSTCVQHSVEVPEVGELTAQNLANVSLKAQNTFTR